VERAKASVGSYGTRTAMSPRSAGTDGLADVGGERIELLDRASFVVFEPSAQFAERFLARLVDAGSDGGGGLGIGAQTPRRTIRR
jgi:hypothetical protein